MPVGGNSSEKQVVGGVYTGVTSVKVSVINPTKETLISMGINAQKEPQYLTEENGIKKLRLDFYLSHTTTNLSRVTKASFWLENKPRTNKDATKVQWVNKFGTFAWSTNETDAPNYEWFSKEGARPAFVGEEALVGFIKAWANVEQSSQAILDNMAALFEGNIKELTDTHNALKNNTVRALLGAQDGKYQAVYTKFFQRSYQLSLDPWKKALEADYGDFKADYQNDLAFKPYVGSTAVAGDKPADLSVPAGANIEF
ncbi:MAG: hypothetical protein ACK53T_07870 [Planctomycetota bacterium]|jgi:hypothetical protein